MVNYTRHPASFKDPSGFVFEANGNIFRQVNQVYAEQYNMFMDSGLYELLTQKKFLLPHKEIEEDIIHVPGWYKTLFPEQLPVITYPYEWSFDQLKDAALLTLTIVRSSIDQGMILKDATPFNIQFQRGKPIFIDTLSFEKYDASQPWVAYRQFCQFFLFPLYLEYYLKTNIQQILIAYPDGIPVVMTSKLLPIRSRLNISVWLHVYLQNIVGAETGKKPEARFDKQKMLNLISHLESIIRRFPSDSFSKTIWSNYYDETILGREYLQQKEKLFREFTEDITSGSVLDIGANDGYFSKLLAEKKLEVIAIDSDHLCINTLYQYVKKNEIANILPLVVDITNPSAASGFMNRERKSFHERIKTDWVMALALVHHLVIGKNISLGLLAEYLRNIAPQLVIEFVPKEDKKVQQMLANRRDVFTDYTLENFEYQFGIHFDVIKRAEIPGTSRVLYRMKRKSA